MAYELDMHNQVSSDQIFNIIKTSVENLLANPNLADSIPAIMLRGAPGVGKSTIVKSVAKALGIGFIDVRLAQMERVDFAGLPSVSDGVTHWNVPSFWPRDMKSKGIILLDEITSAPSDCQVAAYSIVLDRQIPNSNYHLPNGWFIVAAGNRSVDRAVVKTMSSALANRFVHFEVEANADDWVKWATQSSINPFVTSFINYMPSNLIKMKDQNLEQGWPSPRSWERVSNMIPLFESNPEVLEKVVYGLVGNGVGLEFMSFYKLNKKYESIKGVMLNGGKDFTLPDKADERYSVVSSAVYYLWSGKTQEESQKLMDGFYAILGAMPNDFGALMIKMAMLGNSHVSKLDAMKLLMTHKDCAKVASKFSQSFTEQTL